MKYTEEMLSLARLYEEAQEHEYEEWQKLAKAGWQNKDGSWKDGADTSLWDHWNTRCDFYGDQLHKLVPKDDDFYSLIYLITSSQR